MNKDGRKDIWTTLSDVFASIANYLAENGWERGQVWGIQVNLPENFDMTKEGLKVKKSVNDWKKLGVIPSEGFNWPKENLDASIVKPYGGPVFLVFNNFRVIMRYNRSTYYAATIAYMADQIKQRAAQIALRKK